MLLASWAVHHFFFLEIGKTPLSKLTADELINWKLLHECWLPLRPIRYTMVLPVKHATRMTALVPRDAWHSKWRRHVPANQSSHLYKIMPMHRPYWTCSAIASCCYNCVGCCNETVIDSIYHQLPKQITKQTWLQINRSNTVLDLQANNISSPSKIFKNAK